MRVLVLGAYGVIGTRVCGALIDQGHEVVGLGRSIARAQRRLPRVKWIAHDLRQLVTVDAWHGVLVGQRFDAAVNAAGVLQDGAQDDVRAVQEAAMLALFAACDDAGIKRFVQISATRAGDAASTDFMRTKGRADEALRGSTLDWVILRPGLVVATDAYGGTALLRALAALPVVTVLAYPESRMQTVDVDDVARAVVRAVGGDVPTRQTYDLVEADSHSLRQVVGAFRAWLGLAPQRVIVVPDVVARFAGRLADLTGQLGWRSPLRTTALEETRASVVGDAEPWRRLTGAPLASLDQVLMRRPSTVQDRWFARLFLLVPVVIGVLSLFWILSGLIGFVNLDAAKRVLAASGLGDGVQSFLVVGGALVDVVLGGAILWRRQARTAAFGMIAVSVLYLMGGAIFAPHLWGDPLGPMLKVVPGMVLALLAVQLVDER
ncbi:MAG: SDR family oxidoreductase [Hyphomicrobiaceae bacterium]|nr:SDR family oxidoreductase [Hyphomicrobiaceae bacterium]